MCSKMLSVSSYDLQFRGKIPVNFLLSLLFVYLAFIRISDAEDDVVVQIYNRARNDFHVISFNNGPLNSTYYNSSCMSLMYAFGMNGKEYGNTTNKSMDGLLYYKNNICCANVFLLNWSKAASTPEGIGEYATKLLYATVIVPKSIAIGKQLAELLLYWAEHFGFNLACLHLIGHSLGAHLFGNTGKAVDKMGNGTKIYKITGLDPAGPLFGNWSINERLAKTDATIVEGLHSDGSSTNPLTNKHYGINETVGKFDIWMNYYTSDDQVQPECPEGKQEFMSAEALCSHNRAPEVYAITWTYQTCCLSCQYGTIQQSETVTQNETDAQTLTFQASGAPNYYAWAAGNGSSSVIILGACVNRTAYGNYYLTTNGTYPYAKGEEGAYP